MRTSDVSIIVQRVNFVMRIGLDIDNVISDFDKKIEEEVAREDKNKRNRGIVNPNADWIPRFYDWSYDEVEGFFNDHMQEFAKVLDVRPGALEYMPRLLADGHELYLISHRVYPHYTEPLKVTENWLKEKGIPYTRLILSETFNKTKECKENGVEIMFDDSQRNCHLLTEGGVRCFLMGTRYNGQEREGLSVVNDWGELYDVVCRLNGK